MPDTLAMEQAKTKPKLEDMIPSLLDGDKQGHILDFLDYCKTKKISYLWSSTNRWNMKAKGKNIGYIDLGGHRPGNADGSWYISVDLHELRQHESSTARSWMPLPMG